MSVRSFLSLYVGLFRARARCFFLFGRAMSPGAVPAAAAPIGSYFKYGPPHPPNRAAPRVRRSPSVQQQLPTVKSVKFSG